MIIPQAPSSRAYVADFEVPLETLFTDKVYLHLRQLAISRLVGAVQGKISRISVPKDDVLSYFIARIYVSTLNNTRLTARWALAEAERAKTVLESLGDAELREVATEFGLDLAPDSTISVDQYLSIPTLGQSWMLVNRQYSGGRVWVDAQDVLRLLQAKIQAHTLEGLPAVVPDYLTPLICQDLQILQEVVRSFATEYVSQHPAIEEAYPPCIKRMINAIQNGENLIHFARFALVTFLLGVNKSPEEIVQVFGLSPDFNEKQTRYQVDHVSRGANGQNYKTPNCSTFQIYSLCPGGCETSLTNPLIYYNRMCKKCSLRSKASTEAVRAQ